jgi:hypothetical protein
MSAYHETKPPKSAGKEAAYRHFLNGLCEYMEMVRDKAYVRAPGDLAQAMDIMADADELTGNFELGDAVREMIREARE